MFGIDWTNSQTLWLNLTNLALGLVTIAAVLLVAGSVVWELVLRRRRKASEFRALDSELATMLGGGSHILSVPGLGLTMADGGKPVSPKSKDNQGNRT